MRAAVTYYDGTGWRDGAVTLVGGEPRLTSDAVTAHLPRLDGVVTGGFTDHHVHLQLVDAALLADGVLGRVVDLGGNPAVFSARHDSGDTSARVNVQTPAAAFSATFPELCRPYGVEVAFAGAFLTPPGGYPSDRDWAPAGSVREIPDAAAAVRAIAEMADAGATCIKVASNRTAGPVFSDALFRAIFEIAASHDLPVVAHAEGAGEAQRVARLGATRLAHAPFAERLTDTEVAEQAASVAWISTLAIHDPESYDIAVDNVRRFHAAGGTVLYGTDMGNGPTPVGLNPHEIDALRGTGLNGADLLRALAPRDPSVPAERNTARHSGPGTSIAPDDSITSGSPLAPGDQRDLHTPTPRLLFFPGQSPESIDPLRARLLTPADLEA